VYMLRQMDNNKELVILFLDCLELLHLLALEWFLFSGQYK